MVSKLQPPVRGPYGGWRRLAMIALVATLSACAGAGEKTAEVEQPPETLYNDAIDALSANNAEEAARLFAEVERQHPYSVFATKSQLLWAFAKYQDQEYDDAVNGLDRFIRLHPGNRDVAYAYYLKALSYYEQIADVGRDQGMTERALEALGEVARRFPDSKYARDAALKRDLAFDHLAGKEMDVGRFYLKRGEYIAAINRFRVVVEKYQTTTHVPEALHRLVEAYTALGVEREAREAASVLGNNYPGSEWYKDSYALLGGDLPENASGGAGESDNKGGALSWLWPF